MMLYHETHQSKLRVLPCINAVLQGPFFSDQDLTDLAASIYKVDPIIPSDDQGLIDLASPFSKTDPTLDDPILPSSASLFNDDDDDDDDDDEDDMDFSYIISLGGPFSLKVLKAALVFWGLHIVPMEPAIDLENAFVCHSQGQWVCVRRVGGEWYSFDGAHDVPERLPRSGLAAHFNHLLGDGWGVFAVRGDLPDECPVSSSRYGKWVPPEDAQGAKKSPVEIMHAEEEDLKAAIAASLRDFKLGVIGEPTEAEQKSIMHAEEEVLKAAIASNPTKAEEESIEPAEAGDDSEKARGGDDGLGGSEG
ncbi:hypothetical protein QJS10_CPB14g01714 [Acorus calamus]|uniref:ubiquitinyl hydrolase 1 n=1 Tax=Acorus calamus TaxID=4465 RepID=A0AAV9DF83_ACOCL|nr:hypothetical protein QJS10_CPB14g01714 [Acorus calamus]